MRVKPGQPGGAAECWLGKEMTDRTLLFTVAFLRAVATGMIGVSLGIFLAKLELSPPAIGITVGFGLSGAAVASLLATIYADRHGRRRMLVELSLVSAAGASVVAVGSHPLVVGVAAFVGMLNGMGRDRGAALIIDQAILPATTSHEHRTTAFAFYNFYQDVGHALGSLLAGLPWLIRSGLGTSEMASQRIGIGVYVALMIVTAIAYGRLTPGVEAILAQPVAKVSATTRRMLARISSLFLIDSLGGGFLTGALVSYYFFEQFGVTEATIGLLFFAARVANAFSHFGAAWLARRFGLVNTMVFTHIPSSLLLVLVAFAPTFGIAAALFLLREALVEMDVPTRQSYVMDVVPVGERMLASGVTNLVRMAGWALAPFLAGWLMRDVSLATPLFIGAALKIAYDVALYFSFRGVKPSEESVESR